MVDIDIREKLKANCPSFINAAENNTVDFGSAFLGPTGEQVIAQAQNIANDAINSVEGLINLDYEALAKGALEVVTQLGIDFYNQAMNYATGKFNTYINADYWIRLGTETAAEIAKVTLEKVKNPADILKECLLDYPSLLNSSEAQEVLAKINEKKEEIMGKINEVMGEITNMMNEIQKYTQEIVKYMTYGVDYVLEQINFFYNTYVNKGFAFIDEKIGELEQQMRAFINWLIEKSSSFLADFINRKEEELLKTQLENLKVVLVQVEVVAMAKVKSVALALMAQLGL